jgi:hypothetical protein
MAVVLHGSARTTPRVRAELQASKETTSVLARRYGLSRATVNKWRSRSETCDAPMGPHDPRSTVLTPVEEAIIVAFRQRTLLPLDDVMGCLRDQIPKLTRLEHGHLDLTLLDVKDRVRRLPLRENLLVFAKRLQAAATIHFAKKLAHVERRLLRHDCLSPVSNERTNLVDALGTF